jgi:hypothetical protein
MTFAWPCGKAHENTGGRYVCTRLAGRGGPCAAVPFGEANALRDDTAATARGRVQAVLDRFAEKYETLVPAPTFHRYMPPEKRWTIGNPLAPTNIYRREDADSARHALVEALLAHDPSLAEEV